MQGAEPDALAGGEVSVRVQGARKALWNAFQGGEVQESMMRVESMIEAGRLKLSADASLLSDMKLREAALSALLSYSPFW